MKYFYLIFFIIVSKCYTFAQIHQGDLELNSQAQMDALPPIVQINGTLYLRPALGDTVCDIHDLSNLSELQSVSAIWAQKTKLKDFKGLENVHDGPSDFYLVQNDSLINLSGTENITPFWFGGTFFFEANANLKNLTNWAHVDSLQLFKVVNSPLLESLIGLDSLKHVESSIRIITGNLKNLKGLGGLKYVRYDLEIAHCDSLVSVRDCGFTNNINLQIHDCAQIRYLDFNANDRPPLGVSVSNCPNFERLSLANLTTSAQARISLYNLTNFSNFNLVAADTLSMSMTDCPKLKEVILDPINYCRSCNALNCDGLKTIQIFDKGDPIFDVQDTLSLWSRSYFQVRGNDSLENFLLPNARYSVQSVNFIGNPRLSFIRMDSLDRLFGLGIIACNISNLDGFPNLIGSEGISIFQSITDSFQYLSNVSYGPSTVDLDTISCFKRLKIIQSLSIDAKVKVLSGFDSLNQIYVYDTIYIPNLDFKHCELDSIAFPSVTNGVSNPYWGIITVSNTKLKKPPIFPPGFTIKSPDYPSNSAWDFEQCIDLVGNSEMVDLEPFRVYEYTTLNMPGMRIKDNPKLADCSYFCEKKAQGYNLAKVFLEGNATPCTSVADILDYCIVEVEAVEKENGFLVYPVPASQYLQIESNSNQIEALQLMDMHGVIVRELFNLGPTYELAMHDLPSGLYMLTIRSGTGSFQKQKILIFR